MPNLGYVERVSETFIKKCIITLVHVDHIIQLVYALATMQQMNESYDTHDVGHRELEQGLHGN